VTVWQVVARHGKRKRQFSVAKDSAEDAREEALHLIAHWHAKYSGKIGNMVWREGKVIIINDSLEQHTLYEATEPTEPC